MRSCWILKENCVWGSHLITRHYERVLTKVWFNWMLWSSTKRLGRLRRITETPFLWRTSKDRSLKWQAVLGNTTIVKGTPCTQVEKNVKGTMNEMYQTLTPTWQALFTSITSCLHLKLRFLQLFTCYGFCTSVCRATTSLAYEIHRQTVTTNSGMKGKNGIELS